MASSGKSSTAKKNTSTAKKSSSTAKKTTNTKTSSTAKKSGTTAKKNGTTAKRSGSSAKKNAPAATLSATSQRSSGRRTAQTARNGSAQAARRSGSAGRANTSAGSAHRRSDGSIAGEIVVIILAAFCVFLFFSNLGLCGRIGETMKNYMRGTLGILGYAFPVYLPIAALMIVLSEEKLRTGIKVAASAVAYTVFCGIVELIAGDFVTGTLGWMEFYERSLTGVGGGLAGGMWCKLLYPSLGLFGSYLVLVVLALIGLVVITEKSLLRPLRQSWERMSNSAMENMEYMREELELRRQEKEALREERAVYEREERELRRQERESARQEKEAIRQEKAAIDREERRYRMEHSVKGVARNTDLSASGERSVNGAHYQGMINGVPVSMTPEELELENGTEEIIYTDHSDKISEKTEKTSRRSGGEQKSVLAAFTGRDRVRAEKPAKPRQEVKQETSEPEALLADDPGKPVSGLTISGLDGLNELNQRDALSAKQESRTLSELESLDSLHSGFSRRRTSSVPDMLFTPDDHLESRPGDGSRIVTETSAVEEEPVDPTPLTIGSLRSRNDFAASPSDEVLENNQKIDIAFADEQRAIVADAEEVMDTPEPEEAIAAISAPIGAAKNERGGDVLRVVTAGGRVIEVDNDPTVDPLAAKRAGMTQGQAGMTNQSLARGEEPAPMKTGAGAAGGRSQISTVSQTAGGSTSSALDMENMKPKRKLKPYEKPPLRLLNAPQRKAGANNESDLRETAMKLQQTLHNFGVGATVTNISCGPSVTRYELIPDQGVKVSKFLSLTDDIKLNLAAADIRMEAPIPGKSAIGIEVPNKEKTSVCLREVMECEEFLKHPSKLAIAVGKDIAGNTIVSDLARMPHLLVAGTTGSGKSVFVNTMIVSMLYKATPDEVKFIMIDPKMVEFRIYNGIPHLLAPVVTDPKKAAEVLNWAVLQMTDRYKKFAELNVRDIKGYNERQKADTPEGEKPELMPQIVIVVDELSDLMMAAPSEVEDAIVRLAQMARAAGIHLILATQRPSVNVVTGLIKANIPSRVALSVSTGVDSRTIIDMNGAEKLLGNGDMLFYPSGYQKPLRVQGAFVSDKEILQLVEFLSERGEAHFDESIENKIANNSSGGAPSSDRDEYFERAGRFIVESQKASIGNLQRMFKIGFNRAARIMDQLAEAGVVGAEEGTKARKILMTPEEFEEFIRQQ